MPAQNRFLYAAAVLVMARGSVFAGAVKTTAIQTSQHVGASLQVANNISVMRFNMSNDGERVFKALRPLVPPYGNVVFAAHGNAVFVIDSKTGVERRAGWNNDDAFATHPILCGGTSVVLGDAGGNLVAISPATMEKQWRVSLLPDGAVTGDISCTDAEVFVTIQATLFIVNVASGDFRTVAISPASASSLDGQHFRQRLGQPTDFAAAAATSIYTGNGAMGFAKVDGSRGTKVWEVFDRDQPVTQGPVVWQSNDKQLIYVVAGGFLAIYQDHGSHAAKVCSSSSQHFIVHAPVVRRSDGWAFLAHRDGDVSAYDSKCEQRWSARKQHDTLVHANSIAMTPSGDVAFASNVGVGVLGGASGKLLWSRRDGQGFQTVAVNSDNLVFAVASDGLLHAIGLSQRHLYDAYEEARALAMTGTKSDRNEAVQLLQMVCEQLAMTRNLDLVALSAVAFIGCRLKSNLVNGVSYSGHPLNYVNPLSYDEYLKDLSRVRGEMTVVGAATSRLVDQFDSADDLLKELHQQADQTDDELSISKESLERRTNMLESYSDQLKSNRRSAQTIVTNIGEQIVKTLQDLVSQIRADKLDISSLNKEIAEDKRKIKVLKRKELVQTIVGVFIAIAHVALHFIPGLGDALDAALTIGLTVAGEAVKNYDKVGGCSFQCRIQGLQDQIQADKDQIQRGEVEIDGLQEEQTTVLGVLGYVLALEAVDSAIEDPTSLSDFSWILPQLSIDSLSQTKLEAYLTVAKTSLVSDKAGDGAALFVQLEELVQNAKLHISLIKSWFDAAAKRQEAADAETSLQLHRDSLLQQALLPMAQEQQVECALVLQARRMCRLQQHSLEYMQDLRLQFQFWSLEECPVAVPEKLTACPPINLLGRMPTRDVVSKVAGKIAESQHALDVFLEDLSAAVQLQRQVRMSEESATVSQPVRFAVNESRHPLVFQQLRATGIARVSIRVPLAKVNGTQSLATDLFNVRMYDARAMVDGPATRGHEAISLSIQHGGYSQILDKNGYLHEFTHVSVPVPYGYYKADNCPTICACTYYDGVPDKDSLGMCPNVSFPCAIRSCWVALSPGIARWDVHTRPQRAFLHRVW